MQGLAALAHGLFALVYHFMSSLYASTNSCCEDALKPVICSSQAAIEAHVQTGFLVDTYIKESSDTNTCSHRQKAGLQIAPAYIRTFLKKFSARDYKTHF